MKMHALLQLTIRTSTWLHVKKEQQKNVENNFFNEITRYSMSSLLVHVLVFLTLKARREQKNRIFTIRSALAMINYCTHAMLTQLWKLLSLNLLEPNATQIRKIIAEKKNPQQFDPVQKVHSSFLTWRTYAITFIGVRCLWQTSIFNEIENSQSAKGLPCRHRHITTVNTKTNWISHKMRQFIAIDKTLVAGRQANWSIGVERILLISTYPIRLCVSCIYTL